MQTPLLTSVSKCRGQPKDKSDLLISLIFTLSFKTDSLLSDKISHLLREANNTRLWDYLYWNKLLDSLSFALERLQVLVKIRMKRMEREDLKMKKEKKTRKIAMKNKKLKL